MKPASPRVILFLSYLAFLLFGMFTAGIGPVLGELSGRTDASLSAIGGVITCLFLGSVVAQAASGPLTDWLGDRRLLAISLLIMAAGIPLFTNAGTLSWMFVLAFIAGLGQGGVDMAANLVVTDAAPKNTTSALNLLHFFFGLGAFIGPALVGFAIAWSGSGLIIHWGVAASFFLLAAAITLLLPGSGRKTAAGPARKAAPGGSGVYRSPVLWLMGMLLLIYVGVEIGLGSWITTYMGVRLGTLTQHGAWVTSAFWAALAIGRLAAAAASSRLSRMQLLAAAIGASLLGSLALFPSGGLVLPTVLCLVWIGFAFGAVYPTVVALAGAAFPRNQARAVGLLVAMGSIGAAALPLLTGRMLEQAPDSGFPWFVNVGMVLLVVNLLLIHRFMQRLPHPLDR
jgi:fucose permease